MTETKSKNNLKTSVGSLFVDLGGVVVTLPNFKMMYLERKGMAPVNVFCIIETLQQFYFGGNDIQIR